MKRLNEENEDFTTQTGACKFCGQMHMVRTLGACTKEQLTEHATEQCTCGKAKKMRERMAEETSAKENIRRLFGEYDAGEILQAAVHAVAIEAVDSVTVNIGDGVKGILKRGNNGRVKITKKNTLVEELETNDV